MNCESGHSIQFGCLSIIGKLHVSIVDDQIRPILCHKFTFPFIRSKAGKRGTSEKPNDRSIQYILCHNQLISTNLTNNILLVSHEPGQGCFSYVFDEIS